MLSGPRNDTVGMLSGLRNESVDEQTQQHASCAVAPAALVVRPAVRALDRALPAPSSARRSPTRGVSCEWKIRSANTVTGAACELRCYASSMVCERCARSSFASQKSSSDSQVSVEAAIAFAISSTSGGGFLACAGVGFGGAAGWGLGAAGWGAGTDSLARRSVAAGGLAAGLAGAATEDDSFARRSIAAGTTCGPPFP